MRYCVSVLAVCKNESMSLDLWIRHYLWLGVEHFYLIDNGSTDDSVAVIRRSFGEDLVSIFDRPEQHKQIDHYREVYVTADIPAHSKWIIMADLDEFWFCPDGSSFCDQLSRVEREGTQIILSNWLMFGSDGLQKQPDDIRTAIVHRQPGVHVNTKAIFQTEFVAADEIVIHDIDSKNANAITKKVDNERFHLNHYAIQSVEYFEKVKMSRGDVSSSSADNVRTMDYFRAYDENQTFLDETLKDLVLEHILEPFALQMRPPENLSFAFVLYSCIAASILFVFIYYIWLRKLRQVFKEIKKNLF